MDNSFRLQDCSQDEQQLLLSAIRDSTDKKWEIFFNATKFALSGLVLHGTLPHDNEKNIRYVVDLIRKNKWEQGEWDNECIFTEDFWEICKTPICLPVTYMGLLSGEFILYLLYPNQIKFYRKDEKDISDFSSDDNKMIYRNQYNRYYGAKPKEESKSYTFQFEEALEISLKKLKPTPETNKPGKRKSTTLWPLFDLYSYLVKYFPTSENDNNTKLSTMLKKPYEDLFWNGTINALEETDKRLLFFSTILFQWLSDDERQKITYYQEMMRINQEIVQRVLFDIKTLMIMLSLLDAFSISDPDNPAVHSYYISALEFWNNQLNEKENSIKEILGDDFKQNIFREKTIVENNDLYLIVLWHIISIQRQNKINSVKSTNSLPIKCIIDNGNTEQNMIAKTNPISVGDESSFLNKYSNEMEAFFPDKTKNELIQMLRVSIRVLAFCNHDKLHFNILHYNNGNIPRSPSFQWFIEKRVDIGSLKLNEVIACMQLLEPAKLIKVEVYGKNTKKYLKIADISSNQHSNFTMRNIMENIRKHASEPLLKQISEWIAMQNVGNISMEENELLYQRLQNFYILGSKVSAYTAQSVDDEIEHYDNIVTWICNQMNLFAEKLPIKWPSNYMSARINQSLWS